MHRLDAQMVSREHALEVVQRELGDALDVLERLGRRPSSTTIRLKKCAASVQRVSR